MPGSGVMAIFVYKRLTRNPEIRNTPVLLLSNIWSLGQARDTKFGENAFNKSYGILQSSRVTAFTISELFKENQQGG